MKPAYQLIEAPSILGLSPSGVELLPYALQQYGFLSETPPAVAVPVAVTAYSDERLSRHEVKNAEAIATYSRYVADAVGRVHGRGLFPVVLGGDCSILLGCVLALRRVGTYGLVHVDAHADFYQPEAEPKGEAASMDLALVTGRGPEVLINIDQLGPYVRDAHVIQLARRDADDAQGAGSQRIEETTIRQFDLDLLQQRGQEVVLAEVLEYLEVQTIAGYWIHFDVDALDDAQMPAVDYRLPGGLSFDDASRMLSRLVHTTQAVGLSITIFNPKLDPTGQLTRQLVDCLHRGLYNRA